MMCIKFTTLICLFYVCSIVNESLKSLNRTQCRKNLNYAADLRKLFKLKISKMKSKRCVTCKKEEKNRNKKKVSNSYDSSSVYLSAHWAIYLGDKLYLGLRRLHSNP